MTSEWPLSDLQMTSNGPENNLLNITSRMVPIFVSFQQYTDFTVFSTGSFDLWWPLKVILSQLS